VDIATDLTVLGAECDEIIMDALAKEFPGPSVVSGSSRTT
jgi:hypothetical protein